jgi:very-short-patch-repair endonuclease
MIGNQELKDTVKIVSRQLRKNQTEAENIFWQSVRNRKVANKKFYRQHPIYFDMEGRQRFFIADFYCHEARLVVEIDGKIHSYQRDYDRMRTHIIGQLGVRVIRFKNEEIEEDIKGVIEKLEEVFNSPP